MKPFQKLSLLGLLVCLLPLASHGMLTSRQNNLLGKFFVSNLKGKVICYSDGRVLELKKGDTVLARGSVIETAADSNVTLVFSNGTGVYTDEKTHFEIEKFDQEFFAPNNNLRVEPSNSSTIVRLTTGRMVVSTPRLLSGTTMVYETAHAAVGIRGEKILVEADEKQTHVAMIAGTATVNPRDVDGNFVSIGKRLVTGQEAFVKYTIGSGASAEENFTLTETGAAPDKKVPAARATPAKASVAAAAGPAEPLVTKETEATVVKLTGASRARLPGANQDTPVAMGAKLPKGTTIFTDATSELYLEAFPGAIATLRPNSTLQIEKLSVTTSGATLKKQTALLELKAGTVVSTIDPAKRDINDYGVRTPKGIASAHGTSFSVSVEEDGFSVAATADTVSFVTPSGTAYSIAAGNVTITPAGGEPQPPVSLASAIAANPAFASAVQTALTTVSIVVQNNIGNLSAESATNLLTKVANTATAALPAQAETFISQVVNAVSSPSSSTFNNSAAAVAAVTGAVVAAAPAQAAQIAVAATGSAPAQAVAIAAAAAKESPAQASQIAAAVTQTFVQLTPQGAVTPATLQNAAAVAAAVTTSAPNQAAPVAAAVMQALAQGAPQSTPQSNSQSAATIASAVTAAAPTQAVPVAATMMKALTQSPSFNDATPQVIAQTAATLASAVTTVVPPQAQEVATAVMQLLVQTFPNAAPGTVADTAGLLAAAVTQASPDQASAINAGIAGASNQSASAVQASATQFTAQANEIAQNVTAISAVVAQSSQQSNAAASSVNTAGQFASSSGGSGSSGGTGGTTAGSESGGTGTAGGSQSGGNNNSSSTAQNSGSGSGSNTGAGAGSGSNSGSNSSSGSGAGNDTASGPSGNSGGTSGVAGNGGAGGAGTGAGGTGGEGSTRDSSTSIIVTQFDPSSLGNAMNDIGSAQAAQDGVQFDTTVGSNGTPTVTPIPTTPSKPPTEFVASPANI